MAAAHFTQQMALEHAKEAQKDRERRLTAELERFMRHCLGVRARQATGAIRRH